MDSRLQLRDMSIGFLNDQKGGKTKISIAFEELEEKPSILTFEFPNPYASRNEMFSYLNSRIERLNEAIAEHLSLRPQIGRASCRERV